MQDHISNGDCHLPDIAGAALFVTLYVVKSMHVYITVTS